MTTEKKREVLNALKLSGHEWVRPMDIGGRNGSHHSATLNRLVREGRVEKRRRNSLMNALGSARGSYEYRLIDPFAKDPERACPRCAQSGDMYKRAVMNKISRADDKTEICGPCGTEEALTPITMLRPWKLMQNPITVAVARRVRELVRK